MRWKCCSQYYITTTHFLVIFPSAALHSDFLQLSSDGLGAFLSSSIISVSPDLMFTEERESPLFPQRSCFGGNPERTDEKSEPHWLIKKLLLTFFSNENYLLRTSGQSVNLKVEGLQLKVGGHKMFLLTLASLVWTSCCFIRLRARLGTIQSNILGVPHHLHEQSRVSRFVVISVV